MTVNSLANFGVPGLSPNDRGPALMPILSNRYRVLFFNFGTQGEARAPYDLTRQVQRIGRPNIDFNIVPIYSYVSTAYINTRGEWQTINLEFIDDISNRVMTRVQDQIAKQQNFFDQTMSRAGENYKFEMDLDVLAGGATAGDSVADPNILQKYCYAGCQIATADMGEMVYEDASIMRISMTLRFDNVIAFNQNGARMGTFSHNNEIAAQSGTLITGNGAGGFGGINIGGASINVGFSGLSLGGATVSGNVGTGGAGLGISF